MSVPKIKSVLGPAGPGGYSQATGIVIPFGEFEKIVSAQVKCDNDDVAGANDTIYSLRKTIVHNVTIGASVVIHIWTASVAGAGPNAWTELAGATALNTRTFTALVDGE